MTEHGRRADDAPRFPTLPAHDLEGTTRTLPDAFDGRWNLVLVAFRRRHQALVDAWMAWHAGAVDAVTGFAAFEVPVLAARWIPVRRLVDGGMAQAVRDPVARRRTLTVYTNVHRATAALDIADTETVTALLVDGEGRIRWRTVGPPEPASTAGLLRAAGRPAPGGDGPV